jgi:DNA-binding NarL/FixJ family response regulator
MRGRVLVVDDHPLVGTALVVALRARAVDAILIPVTARAEILRDTGRHAPGLVVLDLDLGPAGSGIELVNPLRAMGCRVLIVTACRDRAIIAAAIARGAVGWVSKEEPFERLLDVVTDAAAGREVLSAQEKADLGSLHEDVRARHADLARRFGRLSTREREVLRQLAAGHSAAEVAEEFGVSLVTVRAQIRSILTKLDVRSQLAAVAVLNEAERIGLC